MYPKTIGIIGGAGPMAGSLLFSRLIELSSQKYGCFRDADFPCILLYSFPFSDMLTAKKCVDEVKSQLKDCLKLMRQNGAKIIIIACNTLHAFLDGEEELSDIVSLPDSVTDQLVPGEIPCVLCTSTSVEMALHKGYFACKYPDKNIQYQVDGLIEEILKNPTSQANLSQLNSLIKSLPDETIVLGCTELSCLSKELQASSKRILDPLDLCAIKTLEKYFN